MSGIIPNISQFDTNYIWISEFDDATLQEFYVRFTAMETDPSVVVIPIIISSYGGEVEVMLAMRDMIKTSPKPVATIALGKAMSAGASLLAAGTKGFRFAGPDTSIMVHEVSSGLGGKNTDLQNQAEFINFLNSRLLGNLAQDCGKDLNLFKEKLAKHNNVDWIMTITEAKRWGLIDHIEIPRFLHQSPSTVMAKVDAYSKPTKPQKGSPRKS